MACIGGYRLVGFLIWSKGTLEGRLLTMSRMSPLTLNSTQTRRWRSHVDVHKDNLGNWQGRPVGLEFSNHEDLLVDLCFYEQGTRFLARHASYTPQWTADGVPPTAQFRSRSLPFNTVIMFVPEREAWIVERMGKFTRVLEPGLAFLIPLIDKVRYVQSLKEVAMAIPSQSAITARQRADIDWMAVLYFKIVDPYRASYGR